MNTPTVTRRHLWRWRYTAIFTAPRSRREQREFASVNVYETPK